MRSDKGYDIAESQEDRSSQRSINSSASRCLADCQTLT